MADDAAHRRPRRYGVSFNNGSYVSIARQLSAQPPFAVTSTSIGSIDDPLRLSDPLDEVDKSTTTNNFGADKNYQIGVIHTWNLDINRNAGRGWQFGAGYTGTRGTHLDVLRAPNRDPDGLRIDGVQAFLWESSEGRSILHAVTLRLRKQQARGIAGGISYTLAKSMDDASSIGGGGRVVAQDDQNLAAEWGRSRASTVGISSRGTCRSSCRSAQVVAGWIEGADGPRCSATGPCR